MRPYDAAFRIATSIPPSSSRTVAAAASTAARSLTSSGTGTIPWRCACCSSSMARRALIATRAPRAASSAASASPMPLDAPVIQTRLPPSFIGRSSTSWTSPIAPCRKPASQ